MKHRTQFFIISFLFNLLFIITACSRTFSPPKVTTTVVKEGVPGSININKAEVTTTTAVMEGVPGSVTIKSMELIARITGMDTENRKVTLLSSKDEKRTVRVPPEVIDFDQIQVGDMIKAVLTEEAIIYLDQEDTLVPDKFAADVVAIPSKDKKPGSIVIGTVKVTATVTAIDQSQHTATLHFNDGVIKTFPVRDDIDLSKHKVGEKVVFIFTEMVALSVEKP